MNICCTDADNPVIDVQQSRVAILSNYDVKLAHHDHVHQQINVYKH